MLNAVTNNYEQWNQRTNFKLIAVAFGQIKISRRIDLELK